MRNLEEAFQEPRCSVGYGLDGEIEASSNRRRKVVR